MKKRTFIFDGSEGAAEMMVAILNHFTSIAYPIGGSDCAAASREALQAIQGGDAPERVLDFAELTRAVGFPEYYEGEQRYSCEK